jgi:predicted metal-dependent hydrolase
LDHPAGEPDLAGDPRLREAVEQFNHGDWYASHDGFEALWHETLEPERTVLQGILQIAVAHLHRERGNLRGATVLLGEGLGRLSSCGDGALGFDLALLRTNSARFLEALQQQRSLDELPAPCLRPVSPQGPPVD